MIALLGFALFFFALTWVLEPVFSWSANMFKSALSLSSEMQLVVYRKAGDKAYISFLVHIISVIFGLAVGVIAISTLWDWGASKTIDDGLFIYSISLSMPIAAGLTIVTAPVFAAIQAKAIFSTFILFRREVANNPKLDNA